LTVAANIPKRQLSISKPRGSIRRYAASSVNSEDVIRS
jgi:hypothetical protein